MKAATFKGFLVYRLLANAAVSVDLLKEKVQELPAGDPEVGQMRRSGFIESVPGAGELVTELGHKDYVMLTLQTALRIVPNKVVNRELAKRVKAWEGRYQRVPTGAEKQALKNDVIVELMEHALLDYERLNVLIAQPYIFIETTSAKKAEVVLGALRRCLGTLPVQPLTTKNLPVECFTSWVSRETKPEQLTVGEQFSAKSRLEGTQSLAGKNVELLDNTLSDLLSDEYQIVTLQLNYYDDRLHGTVSFLLNENLAFKSVSWPDALVDMAQDEAGDDETGINLAKATMLLTTSALLDLTDGVLSDLGGEFVRPVTDEDKIEQLKEDLAGVLGGARVEVDGARVEVVDDKGEEGGLI